jgi:PKD repeat protein
MRRPVVVLILALLLYPHSVSAECGKNPTGSTFYIRDECDYAKPCLEDQANTLRIEVDTACYPWWKPCQSFTFDACDIVDWDFGDGSSVRVTGSASVSHVWAEPGYHTVHAHITNSSGEKETDSAIIIVRKPPALVHWSADQFTASETDPEITLTLEREGDMTRDVPVLFCSGVGAASGEAWDRNLEHNWDLPIVIPAGVASMPVKLKIRDDNVYLGEQRYDVFVYDNQGEALLPTVSTIGHTEVRILDNEPGPTITVGDVTVEEGDSGSQIVRIPHILSQPLAEDLMLWWQIGDGTATLDSDWDTMTGGSYFVEQYIRAGQTRTDLEIRVHGDRQAEDDETIVAKVQRSLGPAVTFNQPKITITIKDDDLYELTPGETQVKVGTAVPITVALARPQPVPTTAQLESSESTVLQVPPAVTIPAGAREATFQAQTLRPGVATVTARFNDGNSVDTRIVAELRATLGFWSQRERFEPGETARMMLTTEPAVAVTARIDVSPSGIAVAPSTVTLDAAGTAAFDVEGIKPGSATVTVTLPPEYGGTSQSLDVTVVATLTPRISDVTPPFGSTDGGTRVTVRGSDFAQNCSVKLGGLQATSAWVSASEISAIAPPHAAGAVDVEVHCGTSTATRSAGFRYVAPARRRAVR